MLDFTGYGENILTFKAVEGTASGDLVFVLENETVAKAPSGTAFCGIAKNIRNGMASVVMSGYVETTYSGDAPSLGYTTLVAGENGVESSASGRSVTVISVDEDTRKIGFIF